MMKIKSLFRRGGQGQTASSKNLSNTGVGGGTTTSPPITSLKEATSISSLDSKHKIAPLHPSKLTKATSKEKLDKNEKANNKIANNERSGNNKSSNDVLRNNNRIEVKDSSLPPTPIIPNGDTKTKNINQVCIELFSFN